MENRGITIEDVFAAYKKVKHYFYYDNTSLFIREKIAEFEERIRSKGGIFEEVFRIEMQHIADRINTLSLPEWEEYFQKNIGFRITPKSFKIPQPTILTNKVEVEKLVLKRVNIIIDASVEIQIISALWLMYAGRLFSKRIDGNNYAYKLELKEEDDDNIVNGLRLYKPYFIQYQAWRDEALKKAEQLLNEKKDVVILSLDIKDYFHSVRMDLMYWKEELYKHYSDLKNNQIIERLFYLLNRINLVYTSKIAKVKRIDKIKEGESVLPIGLLSSGLLGNLYMLDFDEEVKEKLNPAYYGRYVDDLLFVFSNVKVHYDSVYPVNDFLVQYFVKREIFDYENLDELSYFHNKKYNEYSNPDSDFKKAIRDTLLVEQAQQLRFSIRQSSKLVIQSEKVILQSFDYRESRAIINKFKKRLEENRSEFRFLPDEDETDKEFDEDAFSLHYSDSINKLRSIKNFSEDKYGASKYLANKIFASSYSDEKPNKQTSHQILTFFKGAVGLSFYTLWEKVATYFILNKQSLELSKFKRQISRTINRIDFSELENVDEDVEYKNEIKEYFNADIRAYLKIAIATPLALNPDFEFIDLDKAERRRVSDTSFKRLAVLIRRANMFRHTLVSIPALNFTNYCDWTSEDLTCNFDKGIEPENLKLNKTLIFLAPRYVHFHELNILKIFETVTQIADQDSDIQLFDSIPLTAFSDYWDINYAWRFYQIPENEREDRVDKLRQKYFDIPTLSKDGRRLERESNSDSTFHSIINVNYDYDKDVVDKKVAIANIKVKKENIEQNILGSPNTSRGRSKELFRLINLVEEEKCDLFVLPEVSVPCKWIKLLVYQSHKRRIGIVAGLEHWINAYKFAFNFMVTILPIRNAKYTTCLVKIRLKNHYSHEEIRQLKGHRLLLPPESKSNYKNYDLFHWRKVYFSVYNCFELANIRDRALFKSKVDFIVASEYNKDTAYFSDIAGSWVRDLHCFFVQVNSSDYGDSRLLQPAKSYLKDIIQIKGGENSTVLVGKLAIEKLRSFQLVEYELQKELIDGNKTVFKPTPPDFNRGNVQIRIADRNIE